MAALTEHDQHVVDVMEATAQARAMLLHVADVCGADRDKAFTALLGAAIASSACREDAVELLRVGEHMLAQARVQITVKRGAVRTHAALMPRASSAQLIDVQGADLEGIDLPDREAEVAADKLIKLAAELHHGNTAGAIALLISTVAEFAARTTMMSDLLGLAVSLLSAWRAQLGKELADVDA